MNQVGRLRVLSPTAVLARKRCGHTRANTAVVVHACHQMTFSGKVPGLSIPLPPLLVVQEPLQLDSNWWMCVGTSGTQLCTSSMQTDAIRTGCNYGNWNSNSPVELSTLSADSDQEM